jgi:mannan endo-1,4-beta-mannosidase
MKITVLILLFVFIALVACKEQPIMNVNPNATKEARNLLNFLYDIQGRYILAGQHNYISTESIQSESAKTFTGKYPIVWGSDFSFCYEGEEPKKFQHCGPINLTMPGDSLFMTGLTPKKARGRLVRNAIKLSREGFIITLMWHACPPGSGDCCDGRKIWTWDKRPSQEEWDQLVTEGTDLNRAWKKQADTIAGYLKQLQEANVPILWRPYHEMNGVWFWWCNKPGESGFKKLWIMMYAYFVNHHQLNNLVWVWNTNAPRDRPGDEAGSYDNFWPGSAYVDVLAADVYRRDWKQSHHDDLLNLAKGKPIALGEVGNIPPPEVLAQQPMWTWFMPWFSWEYREDSSRGDVVKAVYALPHVLTKEDVVMDDDGRYRIKTP